MSRVQYLAELTAYDLDGATTVTLRYCTGKGFVTTPSETPANTVYEPRLTQPLVATRHMFAPGATSGRSVVGNGDLVLANDDGLLDDLSTDYAFDGRALVLRRGTEGAAYPAGFPVYATATMEQVEVGRDTVIVRVKDRAFALEQPLQPTLYAGDNVLPDGLEGTADDLKGKPKPLAFGVVKNATLPCVNTARLIYQVNDGPILSVSAVYDAGIKLFGRTIVSRTADSLSASAIRGLAYGNGTWVAVGGTGLVDQSADSVTWTSVSAGFGAVALAAVAYGNGLWIVGGDNEWRSSPDLVTWSAISEPAGWSTIYNLHYAAGLWVAVGDGGRVATSTDGATWTNRTSGFSSSDVRCVTYGAGLWVIGGNDGKVATSDTGTTWTLRSSSFGSNAILGLTYANGLFVAVGVGGNIMTSVDALVWTGRTSITSASLNEVAYGYGRFVAVGTGSTFITSPDGIAWSARRIDTGGLDPTSVAADTDQLIVVGGNGGLLRAQGDEGDEIADLTDLEDDSIAPEPGSYGWVTDAAGSYIRIGGAPFGAITADFTVGATSADRTAAQLFAAILTQAGYSSSDWVAADLTALDAADNSECGLFLGTTPTTIASALDAVANTVGAAWWPRASDGDFRLVQLLAPSGTAALTITPDDLVEPLRMVPTSDAGRGLPRYQTTLRYAPNWTVQTDGLAAGVTDARRAYLAAGWRETTDTDAAVQTAYLLAPATVEDTLYVTEADANAEATRRQALFGVRRRRFEAVIALNDDADALDVGDVVELEHTRFGLTPAVSFRILGLEPNARDNTLRLHLWGG